MAKKIIDPKDTYAAILRGVDKLADTAKATLGPKDRAKDGMTLTREVELLDPLEDIGAQLVREVAKATTDLAGDGATTAALLFQALCHERSRNVPAGADLAEVQQGIEMAVHAAVQEIDKIARPVGGEAVAQVGILSADNDEEIGRIVAEAMEKVGKDGVIVVEEGSEMALEVFEGMRLDGGYLSPYFVTDAERTEAVLDRPKVLLCDDRITEAEALLPILEETARQGRSLLILAEGLESEALALLVVNQLRATLRVAAARLTTFGVYGEDILQDVALLTGGRVVVSARGIRWEDLGEARKAVLTDLNTTIAIALDAERREAIAGRIEQIREQIEKTSVYQRASLEKRLARLSGGVAVIRVGAADETMLQTKKTRVKHALHATRGAIEEGVVPGGGVALLRAAQAVEALQAEGDVRTGVQIVRRALEEPARQIAINSGTKRSNLLKNLLSTSGNTGYNARTGKLEDLVAAGVIDPAKVTKIALLNAASIFRLTSRGGYGGLYTGGYGGDYSRGYGGYGGGYGEGYGSSGGYGGYAATGSTGYSTTGSGAGQYETSSGGYGTSSGSGYASQEAYVSHQERTDASGHSVSQSYSTSTPRSAVSHSGSGSSEPTETKSTQSKDIGDDEDLAPTVREGTAVEGGDYTSGVGTRFGAFGKIFGGLTGASGRDRVREPYKEVCKNFFEGDRGGDPPEKRISIWVDEREREPQRPLRPGEIVTLCFKVGQRVTASLVDGPATHVPLADIPEEGLPTEWVVSSSTVMLIPGTNVLVDGAVVSRATFPLLIPRDGESAVVQLKALPQAADGARLDVLVYARGALYRQLEVELLLESGAVPREPAPAANIRSEMTYYLPGEIGRQPAQAWARPPGTLWITVAASQTHLHGSGVPTGAGLWDPNEWVQWPPRKAEVADLVYQLRQAAEEFREECQRYLDDIPAEDFERRLQELSHTPGALPRDWDLLPDEADESHRQGWEKVASEPKLRNLAFQGYALYQALFETPFHQDPEIRSRFAGLMPGVRLNIHWLDTIGESWTSHIPWGLLYQEEPLPDQPVDPMKFLGLRYRIGYVPYQVPTPKGALGRPESVFAAHCLYWGTNDSAGTEAQWQRARWSRWPNQVIVPVDPSGREAKNGVRRLLTTPEKKPMAVLYFFCRTAEGTGKNDLVLRFGGSSSDEDNLRQQDMGLKEIPDRPFVFANACSTAAADPYIANRLELAFIKNRGCRAFLGTEAKVPIVLASRFAAVFFHFFFRQVGGEPVPAGEAVAQARLFLWTRYRNLGGLFYCLINKYDLYMADEQEIRALPA